VLLLKKSNAEEFSGFEWDERKSTIRILDRIASLGTTKRAEPTQTRAALHMAWQLCYTEGMQREITQRELRNESGAIMRALDAGESFIVTRNGVPVAEMTPARRPRFTSARSGAVSDE